MGSFVAQMACLWTTHANMCRTDRYPYVLGSGEYFLVICIAKKLQDKEGLPILFVDRGLGESFIWLIYYALYDICMGGRKTFAATLMSQHSAQAN